MAAKDFGIVARKSMPLAEFAASATRGMPVSSG